MKLSGIDVFGFAVAAFAALFAVVSVTMIQPAFLKMLADLGGELPWLTRVMLMPAVALALGLLPLAVVVSSVAMNADQSGRVVRVIVAGLLAAAQIVLSVAAMYLPVWSLAGQIK